MRLLHISSAAILAALCVSGAFAATPAPQNNNVPAPAPVPGYHILVAADGSGDCRSIQEAIDRCPDFRNDTTIVLIKEGVYPERINISPSKRKLKLVGQGDVTITSDKAAPSVNPLTGDNMGTFGSATAFIFPDDFTAENITFANTAGVDAGQAVAVLTGGDRQYFKNCRFLGFQDTLFTWSTGRQLYDNCLIEGSVDFIFGASTALFKDCEIRNVRSKGYITAPSTPEGAAHGYVFLNCRLTAPEGIEQCWLSRPWRDYGQTVFINCEMGGHIRPEGWNNWRKPEREKTAFYAEYGNSGPGADTSRRAFGRVLTSPQGYTPAEILNGWLPANFQ